MAPPAEDRAREGVFLIMQYPVKFRAGVTSFQTCRQRCKWQISRRAGIDTMEFIKWCVKKGVSWH